MLILIPHNGFLKKEEVNPLKLKIRKKIIEMVNKRTCGHITTDEIYLST